MSSRVVNFLKEPLLHFLIAGAALFVLFEAVGEGGDPPQDLDVISLDARAVDAISARFRQVTRRAPTERELAGLVNDFVHEEIMVREAEALGLDRGDAVIRGRLRQKMDLLVTAMANDVVSDQETLRAWHAERSERYQSKASATFQQVLLGEGASEEDVRSALAHLRVEGTVDDIAVATLLPPTLDSADRKQVEAVFGQGFFDDLIAQPVDKWSGPVRSGYGVHLVRLTAFKVAQPLPFDAVREAVQADWRAAQGEEIRNRHFARLRKRYEIILPEGLAR